MTLPCIPPAEYMRRWDEAMAPTDHELVTDHSQCQRFWPECKEGSPLVNLEAPRNETRQLRH